MSFDTICKSNKVRFVFFSILRLKMTFQPFWGKIDGIITSYTTSFESKFLSKKALLGFDEEKKSFSGSWSFVISQRRKKGGKKFSCRHSQCSCFTTFYRLFRCYFKNLERFRFFFWKTNDGLSTWIFPPVMLENKINALFLMKIATKSNEIDGFTNRIIFLSI